jgi:hypothetical protein
MSGVNKAHAELRRENLALQVEVAGMTNIYISIYIIRIKEVYQNILLPDCHSIMSIWWYYGSTAKHVILWQTLVRHVNH